MSAQKGEILRYSKMKAKKGIYIFGKWEVEEMLKKYIQLHDTKFMGDIYPENLTFQQNKYDLHSINLIIEKRCGQINRHTCADRMPHQIYIPNEESESTTIYQEVLMESLVI